jgi:hypothetical protein
MAKALGYKGVLELNPNFSDKLRNLKYKGSLQNKLGTYMNKKMGMQFPFESEEWNFVEDLNIIRNNIVHCNGRIYDDQNHKKVQKVIKSYDTVSISSGKEIVLEHGFIIEMINQVEGFLSLVFEATKTKK